MTRVTNGPGPSAPLVPGNRPGFRPPVVRRDDRRITVGALAVAAGFLLAAVVAAVAGPLTGPSAPWLALHLALAGGATTAIAGVMPFFVAALSAGPPADGRRRRLAVALVALGAAGVAGRAIVPSATWLPVAGGLTFLAGIAATAAVTRDAGRHGLMARRPAVLLAYALALANVGIGGSIGTLFVAGWLPAVERWALLRPAHAWTNLVGFVSLIVAGTLLHLLPTVLGTRIVRRGWGRAAVAGVGLGSPLVVAGLALAVDPLVRLGGAVTLAGIGALAVEAALVVRARGHWTTDAGWHLASGGMLVAAIGWFVVGGGVAAARLLVVGAAPEAWTTPLVGAPLVAGWVVQVLVGAWTHLLPAIGPGGPEGHAARRVVLARLARARLAALNAGVALLAVGWPAGVVPIAAAGLALVAAAVLASIALAARAMTLAPPPRAPGPARAR